MIAGIHHITAIASDGHETVRFYTEILGLRLVKKTVNQDDVATYHLFFGDRLGHPGMDLTFFIFLPTMQGRRGTGLVTTISLAVPETSLVFWQQRFDQYGVRHEAPQVRFGKPRIIFFDKDGQRLELVGVPPAELGSSDDLWTVVIPQEQAIRSFYSATLSVVSQAMIVPVLTDVFGYTHVSSEGHVHLYTLTGAARAAYIEVSEEPSEAVGINAAGTVHHIAFRAADQAQQQKLREKVIAAGLMPTAVIDRFYFKSVYFRTPAGILCEIATDGPGFTADQPEGALGLTLALPPFLENQREMIEANLPPLSHV